MVLECDKYVAAGTHKSKGTVITTKRAHDIANAIIKYFWKNVKKATEEYRKKEINSSKSQMHPGHLISREELLTCLEPFTKF
jgi:hypothetical protein